MFKTLIKRPLTTAVITTFFSLALSTGAALACKNNPFHSAQMEDDNLPMIASNETGKCSGEMSTDGKPGEAMQCGDGKCGGSMSSDGKAAAEAKAEEGKKCEGSMSKEGKPSGSQCGGGKCGGQ